MLQKLNARVIIEMTPIFIVLRHSFSVCLRALFNEFPLEPELFLFI